MHFCTLRLLHRSLQRVSKCTVSTLYTHFSIFSGITETARLRGQEMERQREIERGHETRKDDQLLEDVRRKQLNQPPSSDQAHDSTLKNTSLPGIKARALE